MRGAWIAPPSSLVGALPGQEAVNFGDANATNTRFYVNFLTVWWWSFISWTFLYYLLGVVGTILPIVVAVKLSFLAHKNNEKVWSLISFGAAAVVGVMTFLKPNIQAKKLSPGMVDSQWR